MTHIVAGGEHTPTLENNFSSDLYLTLQGQVYGVHWWRCPNLMFVMKWVNRFRILENVYWTWNTV
jgi:hypothetical protein